MLTIRVTPPTVRIHIDKAAPLQDEPTTDAVQYIEVRPMREELTEPLFPAITFSTRTETTHYRAPVSTMREIARALLEVCDELEASNTPWPNAVPGHNPHRPSCPTSWHILGEHVRNHTALACTTCGRVYGAPVVAPNGSLRIPIHNPALPDTEPDR